jgi:4-amino-4-deoxy-L-arabinose transferase-like glycosyltransferase
MNQKTAPSHSLSTIHWLLLLLALLTAVLLRFYQLGEWPPGLYRDEAYNGLDALNVLDGQHALFFPANNGREPAYIYLSALLVGLFGPSAWALRLGAALAGSLTTIPVFLLGRSWFGLRVGLLAAWLWAITLWPVHLSRIGLRALLLVPLLAMVFWLGTRAYRSEQGRWWLLAGLVYGLAFYTYLAVRLTPLIGLGLAFYLLLTRREQAGRLWRGMLWFGLGTAFSFTPLLLLYLQQPELLLGRAGQVSILNEAVHQGNLLSTLWRHVGLGLGMFVWQGDTILRHNPAGRPVFDWLLALPFLLGVGWCVWAAWRQRATAVALLLWTAVMLLPTILAEDTPHFLRAVGLLPAILYFPAIALDRILAFCCRMHQERQATHYALCTIPYTLIPILLLGSLSLTIRDYARYAQNAETGYLFEAAARTLAESVNEIEAETAVYVDDRFWQGWPSLRFLATRPVQTYRPEVGLPPAPIAPAEVYAWPYGPLEFLPDAWTPPALVRVAPGPLARGDLEPAAYSLYTRYTVEVAPTDWPLVIDFDQTLWLRQASAEVKADGKVVVTLVWEGERAVADTLVAFVHLVGPDGLLTQLDAPPGQGRWSGNWWQPGLIMQERRILHLPRPFDPAQHQIQVGLYNALTGGRLPRRDEPADYFQVPVDHWSQDGAAPPLR